MWEESKLQMWNWYLASWSFQLLAVCKWQSFVRRREGGGSELYGVGVLCTLGSLIHPSGAWQGPASALSYFLPSHYRILSTVIAVDCIHSANWHALLCTCAVVSLSRALRFILYHFLAAHVTIYWCWFPSSFVALRGSGRYCRCFGVTCCLQLHGQSV